MHTVGGYTSWETAHSEGRERWEDSLSLRWILRIGLRVESIGGRWNWFRIVLRFCFHSVRTIILGLCDSIPITLCKRISWRKFWEYRRPHGHNFRIFSRHTFNAIRTQSTMWSKMVPLNSIHLLGRAHVPWLASVDQLLMSRLAFDWTQREVKSNLA
jgi:hypothetical protein